MSFHKLNTARYQRPDQEGAGSAPEAPSGSFLSARCWTLKSREGGGEGQERSKSGAFRPPPIAPAGSGPPQCGPRSFTAFWTPALSLVPLPPFCRCLSSSSTPPARPAQGPLLGQQAHGLLFPVHLSCQKLPMVLCANQPLANFAFLPHVWGGGAVRGRGFWGDISQPPGRADHSCRIGTEQGENEAHPDVLELGTPGLCVCVQRPAPREPALSGHPWHG